MDEKHQPTVHGEHLELVVHAADWQTTYNRGLASFFKECKPGGDGAASDSAWPSSRMVRFSLFRSRKPIRIRASKVNLKRVVSNSRVYTELSRFSHADSLGMGTEVSMLGRAGWGAEVGRLADSAWLNSIMEGP